MEISRKHLGTRLSEIAIHNGTVYLAGQIAEDTTHNIEGQTREIAHPDVPNLSGRRQGLCRHERRMG